jgi:hypothetical protein
MLLYTVHFRSETSSSFGSSSTIARLTISQVRASLEDKSNRDLATSAGKAVTKTAAALVTATARYVHELEIS